MSNRPITRVVTNPVRLSYCHVWDPVAVEGGKPKFSVSLIIPKSDTKTIEAINAAVDAATKKGVVKFGQNFKKDMKLPLHDGDVEKDDPAYKDAYYVNTTSYEPPKIVDRAIQPIMDRSEVYSGCYARVSMNIYPYSRPGNHGISCGLQGIQKIRDGEALDGRSTPEEDFATEPDEDFLS